MSETALYDPKTVAEMLDVPTSTLRRYAAEWPQYLSETARTTGQKRRYTHEDILILSRLKDLLRARKSDDEIKTALQLVIENPQESEQPKNALALVPQLSEEFDRIRALTADLDKKIDQLATTDNAVISAQLNQSIALQQLQDRIYQLEKQLAEQRTIKTPWWTFWKRSS